MHRAVPPELGMILDFLQRIGIDVRQRELTMRTWLPGVTIDRGVLVYDPDRLTYVGDLLHEAGHLAFTLPSERPNLTPESTFEGGDDMAAIAWSWAAIIETGIAPEIVFHRGGYSGCAGNIVENFRSRRYFGVPLLQWAGMTIEPKSHEDDSGKFPAMLHWLRPESA